MRLKKDENWRRVGGLRRKEDSGRSNVEVTEWVTVGYSVVTFWRLNLKVSGGRVRTGYFDAQGVYHDESAESSSASRGGSGVLYNRTWTVEGTATIDDPDQPPQFNFGDVAAGGSGFRTQTIDLGMVGHAGASQGNFHPIVWKSKLTLNLKMPHDNKEQDNGQETANVPEQVLFRAL